SEWRLERVGPTTVDVERPPWVGRFHCDVVSAPEEQRCVQKIDRKRSTCNYMYSSSASWKERTSVFVQSPGDAPSWSSRRQPRLRTACFLDRGDVCSVRRPPRHSVWV